MRIAYSPVASRASNAGPTCSTSAVSSPARAIVSSGTSSFTSLRTLPTNGEVAFEQRQEIRIVRGVGEDLLQILERFELLPVALLLLRRGRREPDLLQPQSIVADDADLVQHLGAQLRRPAEKQTVRRCAAGDRDAHRTRHVCVDAQQRVQRLADSLRQIGDGEALGRVDRYGFPAQHVEIQTLDLRTALFDRHEHRAAAARLADVAALQVAGKHDGRGSDHC
jgi:hypothetical protein